ncbi:hypothetical protein NXS19_002299 [Fusarium pseudograminearum]|nr:hypothetical protein NXS19_002299 [Fusarium pseudograminearum]
MSSPTPTSPEEAVEEAVLDPETPQKPTEDNDEKEEPKSAPPAAAARGRPRAKSTREPTLLHDFLLGRPSRSRQTAERQRRMSLEAVKAELRHEMRVPSEACPTSQRRPRPSQEMAKGQRCRFGTDTR